MLQNVASLRDALKEARRGWGAPSTSFAITLAESRFRGPMQMGVLAADKSDVGLSWIDGDQPSHTAKGAVSMSSQTYKYWAFISYSHQDKTWGDWLHKTLETYRVPKRLVGRGSRDGVVPKHLYPIFRDRDELPTSSDLGFSINEALRQSRYLVVVCSPKAAVSRWVNEEVRTFKTLGREDRILCVIVDGEPNASDKPNCGLLECFPEAVRYRIDDSGKLTQQRTEPIAADARDGKHGKADSRLKIIAGLLGIGLDELKQRERRRKLWRRVQLVAAGGGLIVLVVVIWYAYALRETRQEYFEAGRRELQNNRPDRAAPYFARAYSLGEDSPLVRFLIAQALRPLEVDWIDLRGHINHVLSLRYSDDGKYIATASADHTARIWEPSGQLIKVLEGHGDSVLDAAFSPDGARVVTASMDRTAAVWDVATWKKLLTLSHGTGVGSATFSPDGFRILTNERGGRLIKLWDAINGGELYAFEANFPFGKKLKRQMFSPDGRRIVVPGPGEVARIWDTQTGKVVLTLRAGKGSVQTALYSLDGKRIVTTGDVGIIWDAESGSLLGKLEEHTSTVVDGEFSPKGDAVLTASWDGTAKVWGMDYRSRFTLGGHRPNLESAAFSPDGTRIVTRDATGVKIWDAATGRLLIEFDTTLGMVGPALAPSGMAVASPMANNLATLMRIPINGWIARLEPGQGSVNAISQSFDGKLIAVAAERGVSLWDTPTGRRLALPNLPQGDITSVELSADGSRFLTAGMNHSVSVWETSTGRAVATITEQPDAHSTGVLRASLHPEGRQVIVSGIGRNAMVWNVDTMTRVLSLNHVSHGVTLAQFSPSGDRIVTVELRRLHMWDGSGRPLASIDSQGGFVDAVAFSRDGTLLASVDEQGAVKLWQTDGLRFLLPLEDGGKRARSVTFSPDNAFVLTTNGDGGVKFWDTATGVLLYSLEGSALGENPKKAVSVRSALFIPNSTYILVANGELAEIWNASGETRSPAEVSAFVRCRAPWELRRGKLVEAPLPTPGACLKPTAVR